MTNATNPAANVAYINTKVPIPLLAQAETLVSGGWYRNLDDLMVDALRRFLDAHRLEIAEQFLRDDVQWGLH